MKKHRQLRDMMFGDFKPSMNKIFIGGHKILGAGKHWLVKEEVQSKEVTAIWEEIYGYIAESEE